MQRFAFRALKRWCPSHSQDTAIFAPRKKIIERILVTPDIVDIVVICVILLGPTSSSFSSNAPSGGRSIFQTTTYIGRMSELSNKEQTAILLLVLLPEIVIIPESVYATFLSLWPTKKNWFNLQKKFECKNNICVTVWLEARSRFHIYAWCPGGKQYFFAMEHERVGSFVFLLMFSGAKIFDKSSNPDFSQHKRSMPNCIISIAGVSANIIFNFARCCQSPQKIIKQTNQRHQ